MSRSRRGRRFEEPKLNIAKVIITILIILAIIMAFVSLKKLLTNDEKKTKEISVQKTYFSVFENGNGE